ncbi:MAG TPA: beta-ketoacyl-ACP synthase III [Gemmatimonadales bacterium]|nr:beta-ketoacyl-ACP synthase III [Gemmatimonadales bacterium]
MPRSQFLGTGFAVPERIVTNDDLSKLMDTSDEWIRARTGIEERRWVGPGETNTDLAHAAACRALETAGLAPRDLDAIVVATCSPDHFLPGEGVFLQRMLGAGTIPCLDVRTQCSGFVYGLSVADAWIRTGEYRRVLVVGSEVQSRAMDVSTRGRDTAVIFADGAGAAVLGPTDEPERGILAFDLRAEGVHAEKLWVEGPGMASTPWVSAEALAAGKYFLRMDGREVFRHAVTRMPESVQAALAKAGLTLADVALLIPHQANLRISEAVRAALGLRDEQVYNNIMRYGNTTAATIPIALDECVRAGRLQPGDVLVLTAFGSGFAWGSAVIRW